MATARGGVAATVTVATAAAHGWVRRKVGGEMGAEMGGEMGGEVEVWLV